MYSTPDVVVMRIWVPHISDVLTNEPAWILTGHLFQIYANSWLASAADGATSRGTAASLYVCDHTVWSSSRLAVLGDFVHLVLGESPQYS